MRGRDISVVFQEPASSLNPVFTVGEQIAEVLRIHIETQPPPGAGPCAGVDDRGRHSQPQRSGSSPIRTSSRVGQQQRVMIAIAVACEPKLLIADRPTTALDVTVQRQITDLIARLQQRKKMSVLFISHDLGLVGEISNQVIVMRHGQVRETGDVETIFNRAQGQLHPCPDRLPPQPGQPAPAPAGN